MARKRRGQPLCGLLLLDKPRGMSSNRALQTARRLLDAAKGGHGGALDPMAEGVLPLLFGDATRLSSYALDGNKSYEFTVRWGEKTDSGDADGAVIDRSDTIPTVEAIARVLPAFLGAQEQIPPMVSALKRDGQPLYKLARRGEVVDRASRPVIIHRLELLHSVGEQATFAVTVSKGTYIRVLAEDVAAALGTLGHLVYLRRTAAAGLAGPLITLEALEALGPADRVRQLLPVQRLIPAIPQAQVDADAARDLRYGRPLSDLPSVPGADVASAPTPLWLCCDAAGRAVALVEYRDAQWWPVRVFAAEAYQPVAADL
ncbi:MAG: tRNA pseudouridine(55) synthase TruB [Oceanococcaceae bacterium]